MKKIVIILIVLLCTGALIYLPQKFNVLYLLLLVPIIALAKKNYNKKKIFT